MSQNTLHPENKELAEQIISQIKAGAGTWEMPWHKGFEEAANALTRHIYTGYNAVLLWQTGKARGYSSNQWATLKQWSKLRGRLRKGAKGVAIYQPRTYTQRYKDGSTKEIVGGYRRYYVFNYEDVNNVNFEHPDLFSDSLQRPLDFNAAAEKLIRASGAIINYGGDKAFYRPVEDAIYMPPINTFKPTQEASASENYYSTVLHELIHWTVKDERSPREKFFHFHHLNYAFEELVAELGASILCSRFHGLVVPRKDHAAYISSWLEVLENEFEYFYEALYQAQQAVDWLCLKANIHTTAQAVDGELEEESKEASEHWVGAQSSIPPGEFIAAQSYNHAWHQFGLAPAVSSKIICGHCSHAFFAAFELEVSWQDCPNCSVINCFNSAKNVFHNAITIKPNDGFSALGAKASTQKRNQAATFIAEHGKVLLETCASRVVEQLKACAAAEMFEDAGPMSNAWQEFSWCLQELDANRPVWEGEAIAELFERSIDLMITPLIDSFTKSQKVAVATYMVGKRHLGSLPKPVDYNRQQARLYVHNCVVEMALEHSC